MKTDFKPYRTFADIESADELTKTFIENGIGAKLFEMVPDYEPEIAYSGVKPSFIKYQTLIDRVDFEKADDLMTEFAKKAISDVDKDHYLFDFTNEELYEILLKSNEWSEFDQQLAIKILSERGESVDEKTLQDLKIANLTEMAKPKKASVGEIALGYLFPLLGFFTNDYLFAFVGSFLALFIGLHLFKSQTTLPDGSKTPVFNSQGKAHGRNILVLSLAILPIWLLVKEFYLKK
jgi:hypothetical protein